MAKKNYVPRKKPQFRNWHANFKTQAHLQATKYNITTGQLAKVDLNDADIIADFDDDAAKELVARAAKTKSRATQKRADGDARDIAQGIKRHVNYVDEDGVLFDIIGPEDSTDPDTAKPVLELRLDGIKVEISFLKSIFTGVKIFSRRGNETAWTFLTIDTESPYVDNRANLGTGAETRQYQAIFVDGDDEVGLMSDIVTIAVTGAVSPV